jgi:hypothetical protein
MRVSEKGTKQYYPHQASPDGSRFQATKPCKRERESQSQRESGEDEEKRGRKARSGALGLAVF